MEVKEISSKKMLKSLPDEEYLFGYASLNNRKFSIKNIEFNAIKITGKNTAEIISGDVLYFNDLLGEYSRTSECIRLASHTHYSIRTSIEHKLGSGNKVLLDSLSNEFTELQYGEKFKIVSISFYEEVSKNPIFRRWDFPLLRLSMRAPNRKIKIDMKIRIWKIKLENGESIYIVHHANHPVVGNAEKNMNADYVHFIRLAIREHDSNATVIFIQGAAGDIRPNIVKPYVNLSIMSDKFQKFVAPTDYEVVLEYNKYYKTTIAALLKKPVESNNTNINVVEKKINVVGIDELVQISVLEINNYKILILPFEVSHIYQIDAFNFNENILIGSCMNYVYGYLPHESQLECSGYEVDSSRAYFGLNNRVYIPTADFKKLLNEI